MDRGQGWLKTVTASQKTLGNVAKRGGYFITECCQREQWLLVATS